MITTGIFCRIAALTGATIAASSSGARTMPEAPRPTAFSISATCASRSSSRSGPRHAMSTSSSEAAFSAPACMLCQNACDVPFGITAIDSRPGVRCRPSRRRRPGPQSRPATRNASSPLRWGQISYSISPHYGEVSIRRSSDYNTQTFTSLRTPHDIRAQRKECPCYRCRVRHRRGHRRDVRAGRRARVCHRRPDRHGHARRPSASRQQGAPRRRSNSTFATRPPAPRSAARPGRSTSS